MKNGNLGINSACFSIFSLSWIIFLTVMLVLYTTSTQWVFGQKLCLYFNWFPCTTACFFPLEDFAVYHWGKLAIWSELLFIYPFLLSPRLFCCPEYWFFISLVLMNFSIFLLNAPYTFTFPIPCFFVLKLYAIYHWCKIAIWQELLPFFQRFFVMEYFVVHNVGSVYHWY